MRIASINGRFSSIALAATCVSTAGPDVPPDAAPAKKKSPVLTLATSIGPSAAAPRPLIPGAGAISTPVAAGNARATEEAVGREGAGHGIGEAIDGHQRRCRRIVGPLLRRTRQGADRRRLIGAIGRQQRIDLGLRQSGSGIANEGIARIEPIAALGIGALGHFGNYVRIVLRIRPFVGIAAFKQAPHLRAQHATACRRRREIGLVIAPFQGDRLRPRPVFDRACPPVLNWPPAPRTACTYWRARLPT